ncbi:MAG: hypothetical protein ACYSW3_26980 [Planctomycetota bacterium]|jgi:hypothetical protein
MVQHEPKSCQFCSDQFTPHPKVGLQQIACTKAQCQRARKRANLKRFYRSDPGYNYDNVKRYRASHPDYQKQWRQKRKEKRNALRSEPKAATAGSQQQIPASLVVSPQAGEIQTALNSVKTVKPTKGVRTPREIQTELTLYFSVQLSRLLGSLPELQKREIQIELSG